MLLIERQIFDVQRFCFITFWHTYGSPSHIVLIVLFLLFRCREVSRAWRGAVESLRTLPWLLQVIPEKFAEKLTRLVKLRFRDRNQETPPSKILDSVSRLSALQFLHGLVLDHKSAMYSLRNLAQIRHVELLPQQGLDRVLLQMPQLQSAVICSFNKTGSLVRHRTTVDQFPFLSHGDTLKHSGTKFSSLYCAF